jgi:hypothetical protein
MGIERLMYLGAAALVAVGCADRDEAIETAMASDAQPGRAQLRIVHADRASGELGVYRGYAEAASGLRYLEVTPWLLVPEGDERLSLVATADQRGDPAVELDERLEAGGRYTLIAYDDGGTTRAMLLDEPAEREAGRARLRVVNLIHDGPEVELFARGGRDRLLDDVEPGETEDEWVAPTDRALEFRREDEREPYLVVPNLQLEEGRGYTLVLTGTAERPDVVKVEDEI